MQGKEDIDGCVYLTWEWEWEKEWEWEWEWEFIIISNKLNNCFFAGWSEINNNKDSVFM